MCSLYVFQGQYFSAFKQSPRREDDISIVTCGMNVVFQESSNIVEDLQLSYGGMAPTTVLAKATSKKLIGRFVNCTNLSWQWCVQMDVFVWIVFGGFVCLFLSFFLETCCYAYWFNCLACWLLIAVMVIGLLDHYLVIKSSEQPDPNVFQSQM